MSIDLSRSPAASSLVASLCRRRFLGEGEPNRATTTNAAVEDALGRLWHETQYQENGAHGMWLADRWHYQHRRRKTWKSPPNSSRYLGSVLSSEGDILCDVRAWIHINNIRVYSDGNTFARLKRGCKLTSIYRYIDCQCLYLKAYIVSWSAILKLPKMVTLVQVKTTLGLSSLCSLWIQISKGREHQKVSFLMIRNEFF